MSTTSGLTTAEWQALGYPHFLAEAFEDLALTRTEVATFPPTSLLDAALKWHGIIGYTETILDAIEAIACREADTLPEDTCHGGTYASGRGWTMADWSALT